jgi:hypothetical protein
MERIFLTVIGIVSLLLYGAFSIQKNNMLKNRLLYLVKNFFIKLYSNLYYAQKLASKF